MKVNLIITTVIMLYFSGSLLADYKVYSSPQNNGNGKILNIPEPGCVSDTSTLENGMHIVCGYEQEELPVVEGKAFKLESVVPLDGFSCSTYATDSQALLISSLTGSNIYTPYESFRPAYPSTDSGNARGMAFYVTPTGERGSSRMFSDYFSRTGNNYYYVATKGTRTSLMSPWYSYDSGIYTSGSVHYRDSGTKVLSKVAEKACVVEPINS